MPKIVGESELRRFLRFKPEKLRRKVRDEGDARGLDSDSGFKSFLARRIAEKALGSKGAYLYWGDWGVWPSSELPHMHARIRASVGITEGLMDGRCELVAPEDREYLECVVACGLYFVWGFAVIGLDPKVVFWVDHDEWMAIWSPDPEVIERTAKSMIGFGENDEAEDVAHTAAVLPEEFVCCDEMRELDQAGMVYYSSVYRIISIRQSVGGFPMNHCPFCASKLPSRLIERWDEEAKRLVGPDAEPSDVPSEFWTDEWWRRRGL